MKKKNKGSTVIFIMVFLIGLSLLLYPTVANYWNSLHATKTINTYIKAFEDIDDTEVQQMWQDAVDYNNELAQNGLKYSFTAEQQARYESLLNVGDTGVMGYIEIDKIDVTLPIYHGTSDGVLQVAVGHVDWSSLPVGGTTSHCVVSGHRGLPNARLFTDIDSLVAGDRFELVILGTTLTYEVDQIRTVLPTELHELQLSKGDDYCTLVTCTPYGINTHRLLVRGHRVENDATEIHVISEAVVIDPLMVAPIVAFPLLFILLLMIMFKKPKKKNTSDKTPAPNGGKRS